MFLFSPAGIVFILSRQEGGGQGGPDTCRVTAINTQTWAAAPLATAAAAGYALPPGLDSTAAVLWGEWAAARSTYLGLRSTYLGWGGWAAAGLPASPSLCSPQCSG